MSAGRESQTSQQLLATTAEPAYGQDSGEAMGSGTEPGPPREDAASLAETSCPKWRRGMKYETYLRSGHWRRFKKRYKASNRRQSCLACDEKRYELHHVTYERLGRERLDDVVPLCNSCHGLLHELVKEGRATLDPSSLFGRRRKRLQPTPVLRDRLAQLPIEDRSRIAKKVRYLVKQRDDAKRLDVTPDPEMVARYGIHLAKQTAKRKAAEMTPAGRVNPPDEDSLAGQRRALPYSTEGG